MLHSRTRRTYSYNLQLTPCNLQRATHHEQPTNYNLPSTTYHVQPTTRNLQPTIYHLSHTTIPRFPTSAVTGHALHLRCCYSIGPLTAANMYGCTDGDKGRLMFLAILAHLRAGVSLPPGNLGDE